MDDRLIIWNVRFHCKQQSKTPRLPNGTRVTRGTRQESLSVLNLEPKLWLTWRCIAARNDNAIKVTKYVSWSEFLIRFAFLRCASVAFVSFISGTPRRLLYCFSRAPRQTTIGRQRGHGGCAGDDSNKSGEAILRLETYCGKRSDATFRCFISVIPARGGGRVKLSSSSGFILPPFVASSNRSL